MWISACCRRVDAVGSNDFVVTVSGVLNNSFFNVSHANTIRFEVESVVWNTIIDANYSQSLWMDMPYDNTTDSKQGLMRNVMVYGVSMSGRLDIACSGDVDSEEDGCVNVTVYASTKHNRTSIDCVGPFGCNAMTIFSVEAVTESVQFRVSECPCDVMRGRGCNGRMDLFCGYEYRKYSNFSGDPFACSGACCGGIVQQFQSRECALICSPNHFCPIDCTADICEGQHVDARNASALSVECTNVESGDNVNCNGLKLDCPQNGEFCNVVCSGNGVCKTLEVHTNSVSNTNISCGTMEDVTTSCYGSTVYVSSSSDTNTPRNVTFECLRGICQQILVSNDSDGDALNVNLNLNVNGTVSELMTAGNYKHFDVAIRGKGHLNCSVLNATNSVSMQSTMSMTESTVHSPVSLLDIACDAGFKGNNLYFSEHSNVLSFGGDSEIKENAMFIPENLRKDISLRCNGKCQFLSNLVEQRKSNNMNMDSTLQIECDDDAKMKGNVFDADGLKLKLDALANCVLLQNAISASHSESVSVSSSKEAVMDGLTVNGYGAERVSLSLIGRVSNSYINGSNSSALSVLCGDGSDSAEHDTKCSNLSISFPASDLETNSTFSSLRCYGFGCHSLTLYTVNGPKDVNISGTHCPCDQDIVSACIGKWDIYCIANNFSEPSTLYSATNCSGSCCQNVVEQLHSKECKWNPDGDGKQNHDIIFISVASSFVIVCVSGVIAALCWRRRKRGMDDNRYLAEHRNFE